MISPTGSEPGSSHDPIVETLLPALGDDPVSRVLSMMLDRRQSDGPEDEATERLADSIETHQQAITRLTRTIARLRNDIGEIQSRLVLMAAAFEACPKCWGQDLGCDTCGGQGTPLLPALGEAGIHSQVAADLSQGGA